MKSSWRDQILNEFTPQVSRLTLVADPDGLLSEEGVLQGIQDRGFALIPFEDHIAFRYVYESRYRSRWDRGELTDLVVVLRSEEHDLSSLPYDLLQAGRKLSFCIGDLFPNLSYPVVAALDRSYLEALYKAQALNSPGILGDNATKEFILRHVFGIAPEIIRTTSDLLRVLLQRHFRNQSIPAILDERLIQILRQDEAFATWALEQIIPDRHAFFTFLQERWTPFLDKIANIKQNSIYEDNAGFGYEYNGPVDLPFDHDDVRVYLDNFFLEGLLQPVEHDSGEKFLNSWVSVGVIIDSEGDRLKCIKKLIANIDSSIPSLESRHHEWLPFARRWAKLTALMAECSPVSSTDIQKDYPDIQKRVDDAFFSWCERRYAGLYNQSPFPPVMVHHVPKALSRHIERSENNRLAMIVIDGLSLDQWIVLRDILNTQRPTIRFKESAVFAWIPTTTAVSLQANKKKKIPFYFPSSIHTTSKEPQLWSQFWIDQGLNQSQVFFAKGLGGGRITDLEDMLSDNVRVVGLVVDKIDKIMHGMELGTAGMHNQINQWALQEFMAELIDLLFKLNFRIWLTSDHGNIEAHGLGRPAEGAVADLRGERVRVYPTEILRNQVKQGFPEAINWSPIGLPDDFLPLLAPKRAAFVKENAVIVGHGGISIEEVIVPFVEIKRRDN